jgi:two-component system sensor histidine kinase ChiS
VATILIIDDDPEYINAYTIVLQKPGYSIFTAGNSSDGMVIAEKERPDIIVLDMLITGTGGVQFLKWLRAQPALKDTKVIVLSNLESDNVVANAKKLGISEYLIKANTTFDELAEKVKQVLQQGSS